MKIKIGSKVVVEKIDDCDISNGVEVGMTGIVVERPYKNATTSYIGDILIVKLGEISDDRHVALYANQLRVID